MKRFKNLETIIKIGVCSTAVIHGINRWIFRRSMNNDHLSRKGSHVFPWKYGKIFYAKYGSGSPLLLLHDITDDGSSLEYEYMIESLSKEHTVYALDFIGCGKSEKLAITYSSYLYVQMLNDFIDKIIEAPTDVIASGKSASICIQACSMKGENFKGLFFVNPENTKITNRFPTKQNMMQKEMMCCPIIGTFLYLILHSKRNIIHKFYSDYCYSTESVSPELIHGYYQACHTGGFNSKYLFASLESNYVNSNFYEPLKSLNHSIYLALGEEVEDSKDILQQYQMCNPAIEGSIIEHTKRYPQLERPSKLIELCHIFF